MASQDSDNMSSPGSEADLHVINNLESSMLEEMSTIPFACGGSISLAKTDSIQIRYGPHGQGSLLALPLKTADPEPLDSLLQACAPATFGKEGKDVLDETYRKASKLDVTEFLTDFCPYKIGIIDVISQLLLPNVAEGPRGVEAELYKLNVYSGPSGRFKPHVDTPRGEGQFGSLVVCLPVEHVGGELVVRHAGKKLVFDRSENASKEGSAQVAAVGELPAMKKIKLDPSDGPTDARSKVHWGVFYSDCEHEVLEVTSGHRLTLTYNLFITELAAGKCAGLTSSPLDSTQLGFYKKFKAALSNRDFFTGGHVLATGLSHAYAHTSERLQMVPTALKGYDMYLYEVCRALGLQCFFRPVIEVEDRDERGSHSYVGRHLRFAASMYGEHDEGLEYGIEEGWPATMLDECRVKWLKHGLGRWDEPGLAYVAYGNQAEQEVAYSSAVMFIVVPPYESRIDGSRAEKDGGLSPLIWRTNDCILG